MKKTGILFMSCALGEVCSSSLLCMTDSKYENETPQTVTRSDFYCV